MSKSRGMQLTARLRSYGLISIIHPDSQTCRLNCMRAAEMLQRHCSGCESERGWCCSAGKGTPPIPQCARTQNKPNRKSLLGIYKWGRRFGVPASHSWQGAAVIVRQGVSSTLGQSTGTWCKQPLNFKLHKDALLGLRWREIWGN